MGNFTQKRWEVSSRDIGENGKTGFMRNGSKTTRNPGRDNQIKNRRVNIKQNVLHPNDLHYLDMSFEFYPCQCKLTAISTVKLAIRCHDCLMSIQSRISHMKTKI